MSFFQRLHLRSLIYYFLTGLILVVPALMNNYPLVYSDSGTYMDASRSLMPPIDRPIGYSLIIRAVTWQSTMWTVVFFQGMVASWLIRETMRTLFPALRDAWRPHVIMLTLLLLLSSLPWYASQLMPDVYSGLLALFVFLLLFGRSLSAMKIVLLWVLLFFFTLSHYSHLVMMIAMAGGAIVLAFRWRRWSTRGTRMAIVGLVLVPVIGILFVKGYNERHGLGYVLSPTSSLFLSGKLIESGVMYTYLERNCPDEPNLLCDHMAELNTTGMHYVWDQNAPTRQGLGLVEASARLDTLVGNVLSDPTMWPMLIWTSCISTAVQFTQVSLGSGIEPYRENSNPYYAMRNLQHELPAYANSAEQRGALDFKFISNFALPLVLLGGLLILVLWPARAQVRLRFFTVLLVAMTIINAAATGALANVYDRLQARVTWLILFVALVLMLERWAACRAFFFFPRSDRADK